MGAACHWKRALPFYLQISLRFSFVGWAAPLTLTLLATIWVGLTERRFAINRAGLVYAAIFGTFFFLLAFLTAVGDDLCRNHGTQEATIAWNPSLVWRVFLYGVALFFLIAAFLAYHQGVWLSVTFVFFSIGSAIAARVWL
jgi:hypothetical protein